MLTRMQWKKQNNTAVGLDIGKDSVKLVQLRQEGEVIKLSKIDSAGIAAVSTVGPESKQAIKRVIANLLTKNQIKSKDVALGINGQSVFIKFLEILPVSPEKLEQTIKYEVQQQIPFSLEEVEWDVHLLKPGPEQKPSSYRVLLVAIKKDKLAARKSLVEGINLHASVLDVSTLSIYNCIRFNQTYDESKFTVVLNIGSQSTDLLILKGNNFWMRSFAIGGDNITAALQKKLNIGFAEAQKLKQRMSVDAPEVKEAIKPVLEDLQGEITRSIDYYNFQQKQTPFQQVEKVETGEVPVQQPVTGEVPVQQPVTEQPPSQQPGSEQPPSSETASAQAPSANTIDEILLGGGTAQMLGLDKFLAQGFSCEVKPVEPFDMLHLDAEMKKKLSSQNKVLFLPAVGLALRALAKSQININLLKEQHQARRQVHQRLLFGVGSVVLALLILFGASTFMRQDYREKTSRLQHLKSLLDTFSKHQPRIEELERSKSLFIGQVNVLRNLAVNRSLWLEVLAQLQQMLADDLWITEFVGAISFDDSFTSLQGKLNLHGKAASYDGVNDFVSSLKSSALFTEVKPLSSAFIEEDLKNEEKVEVVKFSISMKVLTKNIGNK